MDSYPRWDELRLDDRLRIAALEAQVAGVAEPFLEAIHATAYLLEKLGSIKLSTEQLSALRTLGR